jgi:serine/threonine protein kinase
MVKSGGELLGKGTSGCVFHPSIECLGRRGQLKRGVSKIFTDDDSWMQEVMQTNKVAKIDPKSEYTNRVLDKCTACREHIEESDQTKCTWIKDNTHVNKWNQIIYEHKGVDFEKYIENNKYTFKDVICHLVKYAEAIALLKQHNYTHLDIKAPNMLITDSNKAILIDFGMSRDTNTVYHSKNEWFLNHKYLHYPPEFRFYMRQIYHKIPGINELYKLSEEERDEDEEDEEDKEDDDYIGIYKNLPEPLGTETYKRMNQDYNETIDSIYNKTRKVIYIDQLNDIYNEEFSSKIDVFSFGIVILTTLQKVKIKLPTINSRLFDECVRIGENASHINPYNRTKIEDVVIELKKLLAEIEASPKGGGGSLKHRLKQYKLADSLTKHITPQKIQKKTPQKTQQKIQKTTEKTIPQKTPKTIPQKTPKTIPQKTPKTIPQKIPKTTEKTIPKTTRQKTQKTIPTKDSENANVKLRR